MVSKAILRYIRITPRKFRQIIPLVKGKSAEQAIGILMGVKKKASLYAIDLIKSAIANSKRNVQNIDTSTLFISRMIADPGPQLKRFRAASMGRASMIRKRTSHLTVELDVVKIPEAGAAKTTVKKEKESVKPARAGKFHKVAAAVKRPKVKAAAKK